MAKSTTEIRNEIHALEKEMVDARKNEQITSSAKDAAVAIKAMYDAFVEQGFTEEQAYELTVISLKKS